MTTDDKSSSSAPDQDYLSFNPADLVSMRVRPAGLARLFNVTRNTVSQWIKKGIVTLGSDGRVDPVRAAKDVLQRADMKRLRARVFQAALDEMTAALRLHVKETERGLAGMKADLALCREWQTHSECVIGRFRHLLLEHEQQLRLVDDAEEFQRLVDALYEQADDECFDQVAASDE